MEKSISLEQLSRYSDSFNGSRANLIAMNAVIANGAKNAAKSCNGLKHHVHQYSVRLKNKGITSQKSSGCCWMYAALNCLRFQVIEKLKLDEFELSQNYLLFYDKLEKANYFLESILSTLDEAADSRLVSHLCGWALMQDGGQWDMVSALISKYGVVPKEAMPATNCTHATREMNMLVGKRLRGYAAVLRAKHQAGSSLDELRVEKEEMLATIYRMLCICLGTPPEHFDFQIRTKDHEFICDRDLTPKGFYDKYVGLDLSQYISLINAPTADKPYLRSYTVAYLGNVVGGTPVRYVNLEIDALKKAAVAQLQDGEPVWFGCDVGCASLRDEGVMDLDAYDYESLLSTTFGLDKAERLDYGASKMTHAMVFQGVDLDEKGAPVRWCVENSWGGDVGKKGMFLMTDDWFSEHMYQVVVNKKYLPEEVLKAYEADPVVLQPWDPMGALA